MPDKHPYFIEQDILDNVFSSNEGNNVNTTSNVNTSSSIIKPISKVENKSWQPEAISDDDLNDIFSSVGKIERPSNIDKDAPDFIPGVKRGIDTLQASGYGATALAGSLVKKVGFEDVGQAMQDFGIEGYQRNMEEAGQNPKKYSFKDVYTGEAGLGGAIDWAQGTLGELVPSMAEAAVGALVGSLAAPGPGTAIGGLAGRTVLKKGIDKLVKEGLEKGIGDLTEAQLRNQVTKQALKKLGGKVGIGGAVMPLESGGNYADLLESHGVDAPETALLFGGLATSLEFLGGNSKLVDTFIDSLAKGSKGTVKKTAKELLSNIPQEALQEGGQELFSILNTVANTDEKLLTADNLEQIIESMGAGAIGGGAGAVVNAGVSGVDGKKEVIINKQFDPEINQRAKNIIAGGPDQITQSINFLDQQINNNETLLNDPTELEAQAVKRNISVESLTKQLQDESVTNQRIKEILQSEVPAVDTETDIPIEANVTPEETTDITQTEPQVSQEDLISERLAEFESRRRSTPEETIRTFEANFPPINKSAQESAEVFINNNFTEREKSIVENYWQEVKQELERSQEEMTPGTEAYYKKRFFDSKLNEIEGNVKKDIEKLNDPIKKETLSLAEQNKRQQWFNKVAEELDDFPKKNLVQRDPSAFKDARNIRGIPSFEALYEEAVINNAPSQTTLNNILENVKKEDNLTGQLANFVSSFIADSKLNTKVIIDPTAESSNYKPKINTITLRNPINTVIALHEITHAVTVREMEVNQKAKNKIISLMNITRNKLIKDGVYTKETLDAIAKTATSKEFKSQFNQGIPFSNLAYGLVNEKEFLAQVMGSKQMQDTLKQIKITNKGKIQTAWDSIVEAIMEILGIKNTNQNAFGESLKIIAELAGQEINQVNNLDLFEAPINYVSDKVDFLLYRKNKNGNYNINFYSDNNKLHSLQNINEENLKNYLTNNLINNIINSNGQELVLRSSPDQPIKRIITNDLYLNNQTGKVYSFNFDESFEALTEQKLSDEQYNRRFNQKNNLLQDIKQITRARLSDIKLLADKSFGSISTRLKNINPMIMYKMRELDYNTSQKIIEALKVAKPLLEATKKMSKEDKFIWDQARKEADTVKIQQIADKYGLVQDVEKLRDILDNLRKEAIDVGYDVGFIDEYWPRVIKDREGFLQATEGISNDPVFTNAIKKQANKLGITVAEFEEKYPEVKADIISNLILGRGLGIGGPGNIQSRVFKTIPDEYVKYYMDSDAALMQYIYSMTKKIEARKFFGKVPENIQKLKTKINQKNTSLIKEQRLAEIARMEGRPELKENLNRITELNEDIARAEIKLEEYKNQRDYTENIGSYIDELRMRGQLHKKDEKVLRDILDARFHEQGTTGIINAYKNAAYIDTMGSPISALTQIGDLAWAMYVGKVWTPKGFSDTIKNVTKATLGKSNITKEDLGIERIAQEFADGTTLSKAVSKVFKVVGLEKMDSIGKETLINNALDQYKAQASTEIGRAKLLKDIRPIFGVKSDEVINNLLAVSKNPETKVSDDVKLLLYSKLLDFQPVALSEMPEYYLKGGNGRVFYMLKTYTLKQFDVFRKEVWHNLKSGDPKQIARGLTNMTQLMMLLTLANAGADELKDFMLGKETKFEDNVIENFLTLGGASRFIRMQATREGIGSTLAGQALPPFKFIDSVSRDLNETYKNYVSGDTSSFDHARIIDSIPGFGKLYYWHYGRGAENKKTLNEQEFAKESRDIRLFNKQLENAEDKGLFIRANIDDYKKMKIHQNFQSALNRNQAVINKLKKIPDTTNVRTRLGQLKDQREKLLERYFEIQKQ